MDPMGSIRRYLPSKTQILADKAVAAHKYFNEAGLKVSEDSILRMISTAESTGVKANIGRTAAMAAAIPIGAGLVAAGGGAVKRVKDVRRLSGVRDPFSEHLINKTLRKLEADPDLSTVPKTVLRDRTRALYDVADHLFEPENYEALKNLMIQVKNLGGLHPTILREAAETNQAVKGGVTTADYSRLTQGLFS